MAMDFEIFYDDLTAEAKQRLCEAFGTTEDDENWGGRVFPLAIVEREE